METLKIAKIDVKMIAHRGLSGLERENTMASFIAANNKTYFGTECDIHLTSDEQFVICHDDHTGRVANIKKIIPEVTLEELRKIKLKKFNSNEDCEYLMIPTLREYLECAKKYEKDCVIEVKCDLRTKDLTNLFDIVKEFDYLDHITFISFNLENLKKIRRINKTVSLQLLTSSYNDDLINICKKDKLDIDIHYKSLTFEIIQKFHDNNILVNAWTVNNPIDALVLVTWKIDFITTDILE